VVARIIHHVCHAAHVVASRICREKMLETAIPAQYFGFRDRN
jgi:hypothetical protein